MGKETEEDMQIHIVVHYTHICFTQLVLTQALLQTISALDTSEAWGKQIS